MRLSYDVAPKIGGLLSRQTFSADARHYLRIGTNGVLATRIDGFKSIGSYPDFQYFGGNSEMRGYDYLSFVGQNVLFANAELRFPIIEAALTPIGVVGGVRGVFFADFGAGWFNNTGFKCWTSQTETAQKYAGLATDGNGNPIPDPATGLPAALYEPVTVSGFRLEDSRASYGSGSRPSLWAFPSTSTGRGAPCSTRTGRTSCSPTRAAARRSASRGSRYGSGTTSDARPGRRDAPMTRARPS